MYRGNRYKVKEKRISNFLILYLIIVLYAFVNCTFSKYSAKVEGIATINVARFNILVNEKKIGEEETFNLILSPTSDTINNKIVPDSEGYFEILINPIGTQVSLEYEISFDLTKLNAENKKIDLKSYSLDNGNTQIEMPSDNKIVGEINLKDNSTGLTEKDITKIRVYWNWQQDIINPTFENPTIQVTSILKQKD